MSDIFISYARSTAVQAQAIAEALRALGYGVWRDDELPAHRAYSEVIVERLTAAKAVVVVWSAEAVKSEWVQSEADRARGDHKLVQLSIDGTAPPMPFDRIQCADLAGWSGDPAAPGWRKVLDSVAQLAGGAQPAADGRRAAPARTKKVAICVLPFANMSDDPQQEYFSDGISEDIITDLSKVSALSVTARNNAFTFKGKSIEVQEVARRLNVTHVLEGSVRKAGGRVRITAQLIDGLAGDHLWAERWDRDLTDIFALQDEISQAIVAALKIRLAPEEKQAIGQRGTSSPEAYNLFLMARDYMDTGNQGDPRRAAAMVSLTRRATEIDPAYARAWALLAYAYTIRTEDTDRVGEDGLAAAERALQLDPSLAEPHAVKAKLLESAGHGEEAFAEIERALKLDPESNEVNSVAAELYYNRRRFAESIGHFAKVTAVSEADYSSAGMMISACLAAGDNEAARAAAKMCLERVEKVVAQDRGAGGAMAFGVLALAVLGEAERAREWIERALLVDADNTLMRYNFACALAAHLEDVDGALKLLAKVMASGPTRLVRGAVSDPDLDGLRQDPRFKAMLAAGQARIAAIGAETAE